MRGRFIDERNIEPALQNDELDNLAAVLGFQFVQRWDLYAQQLDDGRYVCVREPLRHEHLVAHLVGEITLGMYVLDEASMGRHLVFDADDAPGRRRLEALAAVLSEMGATSYLERSRRGGHLWIFFEELPSGETIRKFGQGLMLFFGMGGIELFPKQSKLSGGPGSLVRMPFGVHRRTGQRYGFYRSNSRPLAPTLREQIHLLETPHYVPPGIIKRFVAHAPEARRKMPGKPNSDGASDSNGRETPLHEKLKAAISVRDFVNHYVILSPSGIGLCPFHDDHVESFSVNDERDFWYCFACETGGSIIDFWMCYRECDFRAAVEDLAGMLL